MAANPHVTHACRQFNHLWGLETPFRARLGVSVVYLGSNPNVANGVANLHGPLPSRRLPQPRNGLTAPMVGRLHVGPNWRQTTCPQHRVWSWASLQLPAHRTNMNTATAISAASEMSVCSSAVASRATCFCHRLDCYGRIGRAALVGGKGNGKVAKLK